MTWFSLTLSALYFLLSIHDKHKLIVPVDILFDSMDRTLERYERYSYAEQQQMPTDFETQVSRTLITYTVFHLFSL